MRHSNVPSPVFISRQKVRTSSRALFLGTGLLLLSVPPGSGKDSEDGGDPVVDEPPLGRSTDCSLAEEGLLSVDPLTDGGLLTILYELHANNDYKPSLTVVRTLDVSPTPTVSGFFRNDIT